MKRCAAAFILLLIICAAIADGQEPPLRVSLSQLIANPESFNGKPIVVVGFLSVGEISLLYMHQEDYEHVILSNAVWVERTKQMWRDREKLDLNYVAIVGIFRIRDNNRIPGGITDIKSCELWSQPAHPRSHKIKDMLKHDSK